MPKRIFPLHDALNNHVTLEWKMFWKDLTVALNGKPLHTFPSKAALEEGQKFPLESGQQFSVRLRENKLETRLDGVIVKGSDSSPQEDLSVPQGIIWFMGGVGTFAGLIFSLVSSPAFEERGIDGPSMLIFGLIILGLGFWFYKKHSPVALGLIVGLIVLDLVASIYDGQVSFGMFIRGYFVYVLVRAFPVLKAIRQNAQTEEALTEIDQIGEE